MAIGTVYYFSPRIHLDSSIVSNDHTPEPEPILAEGKGLIPFTEVQKHNTPEDCWVVIDGKVYDLTEVSYHPRLLVPLKNPVCQRIPSGGFKSDT